MPDDLLTRLVGVPPESVVLFLFFAVLRPLGLLYGFSAFSWGLGSGAVLRTGIGIAVGLPMALASLDQIVGVIERKSLSEMITLLPKEMIIGYALGLLASLPFFALKYAGAIADNFRGESDSGITDPTGGTISTWGVLFLLLGLFTFFESGGLWQLTEVLYKSYAIWPMTAQLPALSTQSGLLVAGLVTTTLLQAGLIAAPLMILMIAVDFIIIVASRVAQRFQLYSNEFALKNLVAILALPIIVIYVARIVDDQLLESLMPLAILNEALP